MITILTPGESYTSEPGNISEYSPVPVFRLGSFRQD